MRAVKDSLAAPLRRAPGRLRSGVVLALGAVLLTACGGSDQANHLGFDDGVAPHGDRLSTLEGLALFGLVPLTILFTVAALVLLPGAVRGNRYRPNKGWGATPLWFGGPADPAAAVESAQAGDLVRGGASGSW